VAVKKQQLSGAEGSFEKKQLGGAVAVRTSSCEGHSFEKQLL
jgi:hypothetical protein